MRTVRSVLLPTVDTGVVFDLVRQLALGRSALELTTARAELEKLATNAKTADLPSDRLRVSDQCRQ